MNRRAFLKSIATVCGAAVVCPGELVKGKPKSEVTTIGPYHIRGGKWYDFEPFNSEADRKKYRQNVFIKARQQGCTNNILYGIPYWCDTQQHFMSRTSGYIVTKI